MSSYLFPLLLVIVIIKCVPSTTSLSRQCEPIRIEICSNLGYNYTTMPNLGGNELQHEAEYILKSFHPLIEYGCSAQLKLFLCSIYAPMCTEKMPQPQPIGPCRRLCENVQKLCFPILEGFGFAWPDALDCGRFPIENNHAHMCMEGPGPGPGIIETPRREIGIEHNCDKGFVLKELECVQLCHADVLFDSADKKFAEVWITVWAIICLITSIATTLTLCIGGGRIRSTTTTSNARARPLFALAVCFCFIALSWTIRIISGRTKTTCHEELQIQNAFMNTNCTIVSFLNYYFTMAANAWWVVLCICWLYRYTDTTDGYTGRGRHQHLLAWGLPAVQSAFVFLIRRGRDIDIDELTGSCYIGNKNVSSLFFLLVLPQAVYLLVGIIVLMFASYRSNTAAASSASASLENNKNSDLLGGLAIVYLIPISSVLVCLCYEYNLARGRERESSRSHPQFWIYLVKHLMSLFIGVSSVFWLWSMRTIVAWRRVFIKRKILHQKQQLPLSVSKVRAVSTMCTLLNTPREGGSRGIASRLKQQQQQQTKLITL